MATFQSLTDPLSLYRFSVTNGIPPILSTTTSPSDATTDIKDAKYLIFTPPPSEAAASPKSFPLDYQTRFSTKDATAPGPVDLRTVHFAWINKDRAIPEYVASAAALGEGLIKNLVFMERLELFGWLEGVQETSEFITPLEGDAPKAAGGTAAAPGRVQEPAATGTREMVVEPRLLEIYSQERPIGDRNTMLRGEKPIDFSYVRGYCHQFVTGKNKPPGPPPNIPAPPMPSIMVPSQNAHRRRLKDPIILLSPSASALLQISNIKPFLEEGQFQPAGSSNAGQSLLKISRDIPNLNPAGPIRFALYDSTSSFQPDYWNRVVAVFTTGQMWQFKSYKWNHPSDVFSNVRGIYVGWDGDALPSTLEGYRSQLAVFKLERARRSRDKEVAEMIWMEIERFMTSKGWGR